MAYLLRLQTPCGCVKYKFVSGSGRCRDDNRPAARTARDGIARRSATGFPHQSCPGPRSKATASSSTSFTAAFTGNPSAKVQVTSSNPRLGSKSALERHGLGAFEPVSVNANAGGESPPGTPERLAPLRQEPRPVALTVGSLGMLTG